VTTYIFHMCAEDGVMALSQAIELREDNEAYACAGRLLAEHPGCAYVGVWASGRPVLARHRVAPYLRAAH
jgi:hypothetical protein